jgi:outer membrane protein assembly factor BamB
MSWTGFTIVGQTLYAADLEQVKALDTADAEPLWAFPRDPKSARAGLFYVTPAVGEEHVIVASEAPAAGFLSQARHVVWALDREGRDLWSFDGAEGQYVEGGALSGDTFVIGNSDGSVYALNVETGSLRWKFKTGHRVWATPLIVSDVVYVGSMDRHLYALRLSDGTVIWDFHGGGAFAGTPALQDGTLYIGSFDDKLYAIDAETGSEVWRFAGQNWFWGGPLVYDDTVYAVDVSGNVYAVDAGTGEQAWRQELVTSDDKPSPVRAPLALSEDGTILFVGSREGTLYALDPSEQGRTIWDRQGQGQLLSSPVVSGTVVYEARILGDERLRALHVDNGREVWTYAPEEE